MQDVRAWATLLDHCWITACTNASAAGLHMSWWAPILARCGVSQYAQDAGQYSSTKFRSSLQLGAIPSRHRQCLSRHAWHMPGCQVVSSHGPDKIVWPSSQSLTCYNLLIHSSLEPQSQAYLTYHGVCTYNEVCSEHNQKHAGHSLACDTPTRRPNLLLRPSSHAVLLPDAPQRHRVA